MVYCLDNLKKWIGEKEIMYEEKNIENIKADDLKRELPVNMDFETTLPVEVIQKLGLKSDDNLVFIEENNRIYIEKA